MPRDHNDARIAVALANVRRTLRRHPRTAYLVRTARAVVHFGPWRRVVRMLIRAVRPPAASTLRSPSTLLPGLTSDSTVHALRNDGVCVVGQLADVHLSKICAVTDALPPGEYARFHEDNPDVHALVTDEAVLSIVGRYMGAEPELLECTVVVHKAEDDTRTPVNAQRHFHFDLAGWQSLNLFVYLTAVHADSGAHQVIIGTHQSKSLPDAIRPCIPDEEIARRFRDRIRTITGPAGTSFFEDTEAFHRRLMMTRRRVMLNVLYASHRGFLSRGRLARPYASYLRNHANARDTADSGVADHVPLTVDWTAR